MHVERRQREAYRRGTRPCQGDCQRFVHLRQRRVGRRFLAGADLDLPAARFDGVFANASLFHVPSRELPRVLRDLWCSLRPRGVLFASNPRGSNREGWQGDCYGVWHDLAGWRAYCTAAGFVEVRHFYRPSGRPRSQQPWLASVWRKR